MSDKSFGDHPSRNIVKNPLLSTAVVGLSFEDLTHNAVLIPVTRSPDLTKSQDKNAPPPPPPPVKGPSPSGDGPLATPAPAPAPTADPLPPKHDDFDVNEYIARLQGTRYVSAPINANLNRSIDSIDKEENLEEVNLNESSDDVASFSADIAQNLSQLPTVLPQVASAVFNSFSNMLSMKKEAGRAEVSGCKEVECVREKVVGPPPKDVGQNAANTFRITTKKKTYAQIPGILPPAQPTVNPTGFMLDPQNPPRFTQSEPTESGFRPNRPTQTIQPHPSIYVPPSNILIAKNIEINPNQESRVPNIFDYGGVNKEDTENIACENENPNSTEAIGNAGIPYNVSTEQVEQQTNIPLYPQSTSTHKSQFAHTQLHQEGSILPPSYATQFANTQFPPESSTMPSSAILSPPTFANPRRDSKSEVGRTILPPSVARRLNPPTKTPVAAFDANIFVPSPVQEAASVSSSDATQSAPVFFSPASIQSTVSSTNTPALFNPSIPDPIAKVVPSAQKHPSIFFNPMGSTTATLAAPAFINPLTSSSETLIAPPTMFNPEQANYMTPFSAEDTPNTEQSTTVTGLQNIAGPPQQLFDSIAYSNEPEPPKPIPEPPKLTSGNINFRMSKKRPQYYAGPIEGVGAISNNVKPVLAPIEPAGTFKGALFTPEQMKETDDPVIDANQYMTVASGATVPFDLSRPDSKVAPKYGSDMTDQRHPQEYNTVFDMSRQTTESYEPPKHEAKGFGLIGSLKSKLSSLDINKIQDSVATFFDPTYNTAVTAEKSGYQETTQNYGQYQQQSNMEIFVPNVDTNLNPQYPQYPANQTNYMQPSQPEYAYDTAKMQYYTAQDVYNNYQNPAQNIPPNSSYLQIDAAHNQELQSNPRNQGFQENMTTNFYNYNQNQTSAANPDDINIPDTTKNIISHQPPVDITEHFANQFDNASNQGYVDQTSHHYWMHQATDARTPEPQTNNLQDNQIVTPFHDNNTVKDDKRKANDFLDNTVHSEAEEVHNKIFEGRIEQVPLHLTLAEEIDTPSSTLYSAPSSGLSAMLTDNCKEIDEVTENMDNSTHKETPTLPVQSTSSFFGDIGKSYESNENTFIAMGNKEISNSDQSSWEVKPAEKHECDLTSQLIENITSPIQLTNPVEVPLTESHKLREGLDEYSSDQCTEISHITEDTMDTIQGQAANELLEDENENVVNIQSESVEVTYGWADKSNVEAMQEHNYMFQTDPSAIGFYGNNSLFFDDIPNNASDEIKAEFKISNSESPTTTVFTRQMSIPTAPPEEEIDDAKSDETGGIDVQLIEQDAKTDFPIYDYDENVIEPSETDDDKIEFNRERTSEDPIPEVESFTHRVEQFKLSEDHINVTESHSKESTLKESFDYTPTSISPAVTIASYFDTGNYAADTHYRNSLTSPTSAVTFTIGNKKRNMFTTAPMIPPGFEKRDGIFENLAENDKQLLDANSGFYNVVMKNTPDVAPGDNSKDFDLRSVPNCSTQTKPVGSVAYSQPQGFYHHAESKAVGSQLTHPPNTSIRMKPMENSDIPLISPGLDINQIIEEYARPTPDIDFKTAPNTTTQTKTNETVTDSSQDMHQIAEAIAIGCPINIPNTTTQTKPIATVSRQEVPNMIAKNVFQPTQSIDSSSSFAVTETTTSFRSAITTASISPPSNFFTSMIAPKIAQQRTEPLPDPVNFFSTTAEKPEEPSDASFNRLASYFSSPTKTDQSKSFFELSQGQDHLRQSSEHTSTLDNRGFFDKNKNFDEALQQSTVTNPQITDQQYTANISLMSDLTSLNYFTPPNEQIVRTINYFTLEYDSDVQNLAKDLNFDRPIQRPKTKDDHPKDDHSKDDHPKEVPKETEEIDLDSIINNCKHCCDLNHGFVVKVEDSDRIDVLNQEGSFKKAMDGQDGAVGTKEDECREKRSPTGKAHIVSFSLEQNENDETVSMVATDKPASAEYTPVRHHWFYRVDLEGKSTWRGFSNADSKALEDAFHSPELNDSTTVATDGGRFDVNVVGRLRIAVYWTDKPTNVRRCSWFYKGTTDARYVPYTESVAEKLEEEYRHGVITGEWHRRLLLPNNEAVVLHGPAVMVHFLHSGADAWATPALFAFGKRVYRNPPQFRVARDQTQRIDHLLLLVHGAGEWRSQREKIQSSMRPRVVRRGCDEAEIEEAEPRSIDHLLLLCHGVGSACDMRFRSVEEVVDDFRATSLQLIQGHYRNSCENGDVGRIEVLPISWHSTLHAGEHGVDRRLARITLDSIPRLRAFTNDTVLDVLFYTSPVFCQTIIDTVCKELNRIHSLFKARNPTFTGDVSLGGHSLGSVILYDLLCNQMAQENPTTEHCSKTYARVSSAGMPPVHYPQLDFSPAALYALGSPIAIFECIRGVELLGEEFHLPTCAKFFNIFHPYDPIAYRIEPLINPQLKLVPPFLIPHHKGRKRMHLELKETVARVGADIKQKLVESIKSTWSSMWRAPPSPDQLEKVLEEEIEKGALKEEKEEAGEEVPPAEELPEKTHVTAGRLNSGARVDYVLQEAPLEMINEYLFAMSSHVCYWESEDTMLLMLREMYSSLGVRPDGAAPPPSMTVERTRARTENETSSESVSERASTSSSP